MSHLSDRDLAIIRNRAGENIPVPPPRKKSSNEESLMQQAAVEWWATARLEFNMPEIALVAHPNQGARSARNGARMKKEGARKGTLDMQLTVSRGKYHGLWIENKTPTGTLSKEQKEFRAHLQNQGYLVCVCRSLDEIKTDITNYLNGLL